MKQALYTLSGKKEQIFKKITKNKDGRVGYPEFQKMLKHVANIQHTVDELSEFLFKYMPRN